MGFNQGFAKKLGVLDQEGTQDAVGVALVNSSNVTLTYSDAADQIIADLTDTAVTPGNYNLVTVDAKGRITGGTTTGPVTRYIGVTSVAVANTTVTYTTVAALTTASLLPGIYRFTFVGLMQSAAAQTGVGVRISNVSAAVSTTYGQWSIRQGVNGTAASFVYDQLAANTNITSASVATANTNFTVLGEGVFRVTTAGTVAIQIRSETAGTAVTLQPDAVLTVELVQ